VESDADESLRGAGWSFIREDTFAALGAGKPEVRWGDLGPGWEPAELALTLVQADLSRTVQDAPPLGFAWTQDAHGERTLHVGKGLDWYQGNPLYDLDRQNVPHAAVQIIEALQDAVVDGLLGDRTFWPRCPEDGGPLDGQVVDGVATWVCLRHESHEHGAVGELGLDR
jgi:hypothetical protein